MVWVEGGGVERSDKGALTQACLGGVSFELVKSAL